ncbi:hypothetical protein jhhlp_006661 [Lomentospora prolificans]|uniref:Major facilitator superfamily (MFS) profile domain-containing protein n=1 Tax=Lomentospora prolificans TaxID=41688 RepID=A0A2N3N6I1_9PEZI|nr:hypothetical protein jhhlp_006661 [Lomentospora prolificans]
METKSEKLSSDRSNGRSSDHIEVSKAVAEADVAETEALRVAQQEKWRVDAFIEEMETQLQASGRTKGRFEISHKNTKRFTWLMVAFASMGGLLFGLDQSLISGANLFMPRDLGLDAKQVSLVNAGMPLGAVAGAFLLTPANEILGRRMAIILSTIFYTVGAALKAGSNSYAMMITGRLIMGLGVGIETGTVPVYVAETVDRKLRGNLVSLYQFNIALGEVLGFVVAAIFIKVEGNWRYILGSSIVFSTIMFLGMLVLPESPRFLMYKNRTVDSYRVWKRIRDLSSDEAKAEFYVMKESVQHEMRESEAKGARSRWVALDFVKLVGYFVFTGRFLFAYSLCSVPRARRAFVYANIMILLGQFVGINGIMYYMSVLMRQIGFDETNATYMSMVGGGALFIGTIPAIFTMERFGRRFWALLMLPGFFVGLIITGCSYLFDPETEPKKTQGLYLTGLIIYMLFYGPYACLTWVIPSEVYPTYLRSYGMSVSDAMVFLGSFIITYNFTAMQEAMTKTGLTLGFFGGIAVLGWFYQLVFMPETKNLTLEEIEIVFSKPTKQLVRENLQSSMRTMSLLLRFRFSEAVSAAQRNGEDTERGSP